MEKMIATPKMSRIDLNEMCFKILLSMKGNKFRARSEILSQIPNIKNSRPEATSTKSYNDAVQKLIPKIQDSLKDTNKKLGEIHQDENGNIIFYVHNIVYSEQKTAFYYNSNNTSIDISSMSNIFNTFLSFMSGNNKFSQENEIKIPITNPNTSEISNQNNLVVNNKKLFSEIIVEWLRHLHDRTKADCDSEDYLSPTTLESYSRNLWAYVFPYLEEHPESNNISTFSSIVIDDIFKGIKCLDTKRVLLVSFKLIFEYAKKNNYITTNPISDKKLKKNNKNRKSKADYEFIEEDQRALWVDYMIKDFQVKGKSYNDAPLAFLCMLLQGNRPEEACGTKWKDFDFEKNTYHIQNAYKNIPIYDEITMKRIGWKKGDGPLKTPESNRILSLDLLLKELLLEHKENQKEYFSKIGRKWSEEEYVFRNHYNEPYTPDILSKNFRKFVKRHEDLSHIVIYSLRHSFATHCRNNGMTAEVLARIMGHTEYETTQKYYIHISSKQKKEELEKVQKQDLNVYLGKDNKELVHLQNKVSNLQELQQDDIINYIQLDNNTLSTLTTILTKIIQKQRVTA